METVKNNVESTQKLDLTSYFFKLLTCLKYGKIILHIARKSHRKSSFKH